MQQGMAHGTRPRVLQRRRVMSTSRCRVAFVPAFGVVYEYGMGRGG
jgi:hypothetical protein